MTRSLRLLNTLDVSFPKDRNEVTTLIVETGKTSSADLADAGARQVFSSVFASTLHIISTIFYALLVPVITVLNLPCRSRT